MWCGRGAPPLRTLSNPLPTDIVAVIHEVNGHVARVDPAIQVGSDGSSEVRRDVRKLVWTVSPRVLTLRCSGVPAAYALGSLREPQLGDRTSSRAFLAASLRVWTSSLLRIEETW
jgi:hypothetical protein